MDKLKMILLVTLFQTSLLESVNNDAITQQPIRRTQYGFLRGLRLKTEPWNADVSNQMEEKGKYENDYVNPEFEKSQGELDSWQDILERGLGPMDGNLEVEVYLGIQYASLLNSNLRFMPPTGPTESWHGRTRNATEFRPVCPQPSGNLMIKRSRTLEEVEKWKKLGKYLERQEEECLFLNVYVPVPVAMQQPASHKQSNSSTLFPVLMIVHAESFESGTGNALDGSHLSAVGHVVVVTINFRLGILGFFSTGDYLASGNYAILDLVAALQFIKANIDSFNGDANKVTILGHGAGSPLVSLLLRSPVVKGSAKNSQRN